MNEVVHQMFGMFDGKYYAVDDCDRIVIPTNTDYQSNAVVTKIHDCLDEAEIDAYVYHSDLTTESNSERVKYMKDYLLGEKITDIEKVSGSYVVGMNYALYNNEGKIVKSGNSEVEAQWCMPIILSDVQEGNILEYRKGLIMDGRIEICIPDTIRYGIRNSGTQHPYILRINEIFVAATNGGYKYITETGSQLDSADRCDCGAVTSNHCHGMNAHYRARHHNGLCDANFNSCFVTNAKIGTTIIDSVVCPAVLEAPVECKKIDVCHVKLGSSDYTIKMNHKLKHIVVNLEVFVDNMNEVYDREDIAKLLEYNAGINSEEGESDDTFGSAGCCGCGNNHMRPHDHHKHHHHSSDKEDVPEEDQGEYEAVPPIAPIDPDHPIMSVEDATKDNGSSEEKKEEDDSPKGENTIEDYD